MKKATKIWIIFATSLILTGAIIFAGVMLFKWDFKKLSTFKYETNEHQITESFNNISFEGRIADITFELSDDGKCKIVCYESDNEKHLIAVNGDTLTITAPEKPWYQHIGINFKTPKITLYLPDGEYSSLFLNESTGNIKIPKEFKFLNVDLTLSTGDTEFSASVTESLKIKADTGNINIKDAELGSLELKTSTGKITANNILCTDANISVSTGKVELTDIQCDNLISNGDTGHFTLKNVIASGKFDFKRSTGDIKLDGCDANEIFMSTSTGNISGSLLSSKVFITSSDTGNIDVPKTLNGGKCEITTDTGDIKLTVE